MTKISNQYSLTNILTADLANSRLGINNVSPTVALDVTGAGKFSSSLSATSYNATTQNIFSVDGSEKMRITSAGFVGIGRTPTTKLDVYSATGNTFSKLESGDNSRVQFIAVNSLNSANFGVESTAGATYIGTLANAALIGSNGNYATQLVTNNTARLTITSAGNVGIGTASPATQLSILSLTPSSSTLDAIFNITNDVDSNFRIFVTGSTASDKRTAIGSTTNTALAFQTNNTERMRITSGGDLLINTTASHGKLTVNGTIITIGSIGDNALLSRASSKAFGWFNDGTSLLLTYSGVANVGSFNMSTGGYTATSDINKKKDFEESNIGLNEVLNIKPILYRMKTEDESSSKHLGFIAQEVKNYIPQAYTESGEFIGLTEMPIIAALTKAIQELSAKVSLLENK